MYKQSSFQLKTVVVLLLLTIAGSLYAQNNKAEAITASALSTIMEKHKDAYKDGKVADYIPELGKADPSDLALAIVGKDGKVVSIGDTNKKFTMQSISKIVALMLAVLENGEHAVFEKMGYYGTDKPFNHFANLETMGKPLNPMMNAGAILTTSLIAGAADEPYRKILNLIRYITKNPSIDINTVVYESEKETGHRNRGMFHLMKNAGLIAGSEDQLDNYFRQCSIELTAEDLAKIGYFFANHCVRFDGDDSYKDVELSRLILSQMLIAGMYEFSGEYARTVGLPSKSGVGGGITVSVPQSIGIGVFSPALDAQGNSLAGYRILLDLAKQYDLSVF